jgi:uncharacterized protein YgiB involved in biofilm formation
MRRKSAAITLVTLASVTLVACDDSQARQTRRVKYESIAACEKDWGKAEERCRVEDGAVYGPHYYSTGSGFFFYPYLLGARGLAAGIAPVPAPSTGAFRGGTFRPAGSVVNGPTVRIAPGSGVLRGGFGTSARPAAS